MILSKGIGNRLLGIVLLLTASCANAGMIEDVSSHHYFQQVEISAAGGVDWYNTSNTTLVISPFETDSVLVNQKSTNGAWKVGLGYYLFKNNLQRQYLNQILFEANVYQTSTTLTGNVWQYQLPQFNNYSFNAPITSTRLMFDVKPSLFTWRKISPYAIVGVGATWNNVSYTETVIAAGVSPSSALVLSQNTVTHVAWDLGAGLSVLLSHRLNATAEYIYDFLGHGLPAGSTNGVNLTTPPSFSLQSQSLLFGLSLTL